MATDYSKKKNAELEELLKARSLPHTGKKAELVARLQQYDAEQASAATAASTAIGDEDQINWEEEDDALAAPVTGSAPAATAAIAAGGQGQIANPTAVPNQALDTDPSKTDDLSVKPPAVTTTEKPTTTTTTDANSKKSPTTTTASAPPTDFTSGLQASTVDDEIAKRQKRAARFGIQESNADAMKALERAKRFGTGSEGDNTAVKGLDEALPERVKKERGVKRGRGEEAKDARPSAKRRESGRRENNPRQTRSGSRPQPKGKGMDMSEKDRLAAEARKKRFTTAA